MYEKKVEIERSKRIPLEGKQFGRLYVAEHEGKGHYGCAMYKVVCICGNEKIVRGGDLLAGKTVSCGCKKREQCGQLAKERWKNDKQN